ncbi:MAG: hypothetical protein WC753_04805 [Candidatus Gracilibacteria bacterium]|jgi:hypothetical protein
MKGRSPTFSQVALDIVGSTKFGRYPKISREETFNMIISDNFLVPYAGHSLVAEILQQAQGRAIYTSNRYNHMIAVISNNVYTISTNLSVTRVGQIDTYLGDVYIDENNNNQIAICDKQNIYIYNYITGAFAKATVDGTTPLGFIPGYISYQNGRFIAAVLGSTSTYQLCVAGNGLLWPGTASYVGSLQTKPDNVIAVQRFPGRGNLLFVFGNTVTEPWQDIGAALFPYQRMSSVNIDYGCLNPATIAYNENIMVWLAANEKSGPVIAYSTGGDINRISTDGIDFKFTQLTNPKDSYGFLFRQDGHLIYQISFPTDNLTYIYDFNTKKFFTLCDENQDIHIAKRVAFFNDAYYFVSFIDGNLYQLGSQFTSYNGREIPRVRVCRNIRLPDASRFVVNNLTFTIEQGTQENIYQEEFLLAEDGEILDTEDGEHLYTINNGLTVIEFLPLQAEDETILLTESGEELQIAVEVETAQPIPQSVHLSASKNGGESFGTIWNKELNARGNFKNRLIYWNLGAANDFVPQFRFWGLSRFVATDGIVSIYQ